MESNKKVIEKIAVIMTVFNRKEKTLRCLNSLCKSWTEAKSPIQYEVFLTDDGCIDGTKEAVMALDYQFPIHIIEGTGNLFWLGGMNLAWRAAINQSGFDGYLWLNDDTVVLADFWKELLVTHQHAKKHYGVEGIYVGSTCDPSTKQFTYGGFDFINKWTLKDQFIIPNGQDIEPCECAHGNITYVSNEVVRRLGVFIDMMHGLGYCNLYFKLFLTTRNGFFEGLPYITVGIAIASCGVISSKKLLCVLLLCSFIVHMLGVKLATFFVIYALFSLVLQLDLRPREDDLYRNFRLTSTIIYFIHMLWVGLITLLYPEMAPYWMFILVLILSFATAYLVIRNKETTVVKLCFR